MFITTIDWIVILFYFAIIGGIVWWAVKKKKKEDSAEEYFLAGRHLGWFIIGASIFASNIGSEHLVGLAGSGALGAAAKADVVMAIRASRMAAFMRAPSGCAGWRANRAARQRSRWRHHRASGLGHQNGRPGSPARRRIAAAPACRHRSRPGPVPNDRNRPAPQASRCPVPPHRF